MRTFIYQLFKKDKANFTLLAIICLLLCTISYKEIEFMRWQRSHYGLLILQTPGVTNYVHHFSAWSSKDSYYPYGVSIGNQEINDYSCDCEPSDELLLPPDAMNIRWTSVADRKQSWIASIDLDKKLLKQHKGNQFAVQLQKDGKVKLYVTNATTGSINAKKECELKEVGVYQADLAEPEKTLANLAKEMLHIEDANPTQKEMNDSVNHLLDGALDAFLSAKPMGNEKMKVCILTLLQETDTLFEDTMEARRIRKRRVNCLLSMALLSDEEESEKLAGAAYDCALGVKWQAEDNEFVNIHVGIRLIELLFRLQKSPLNASDDLLRMTEYLDEKEKYMSEQQFKHTIETVWSCFKYF